VPQGIGEWIRSAAIRELGHLARAANSRKTRKSRRRIQENNGSHQ
jgi:hypothetical protein